MTTAEMTAGKQGWKFPMDFWLANTMELFERAAYYGFFIVITLYLTDIVGFSDKETGIVAGLFYAGLYLLRHLLELCLTGSASRTDSFLRSPY